MENIINFWQYLPSKMNPIIFTVGNFDIRYYGCMYILAFALASFLMKKRIKNENRFPYTKDILDNFLYWIILSILLGGRFGYVIFYNLSYFIKYPMEIIVPFKLIEDQWVFTGIAGMSYHGAVIGAALGSIIFCRKYKVNFWDLSDLVVPTVPLGYTFGRIGNFINGELYGRITEKPWGMYFPLAEDNHLRHPSQLYEALGEGLILFFILWLLRKKEFMVKKMLGAYLLGYGIIRFLIEYLRQPDQHLGYVFLKFSMGQILCFMMILVGLAIIIKNKKQSMTNLKPLSDNH